MDSLLEQARELEGDPMVAIEQTALSTTVEFISIPEWCKRVGCSLDSGYRAARRNEIAGMFRIGRLVRVNWSAFVSATTDGLTLGPSTHREFEQPGGPVLAAHASRHAR